MPEPRPRTTGSLIPLKIFEQPAKSILSPVTGFLKEAGFTHSLSPARNCTYGCTYCYVPSLRVYGGLKPEDWQHWGQFTTLKSNAAELAARELRPDQIIYCSPLVDPYQPAEAEAERMPSILDQVLHRPPAVFVVQTRGPLILRDLPRLRQLSDRTTLRVSFSITTDREDVRRLYEPHCAPIPERLETIAALRAAGIEAYATLAPILPCNPERLASLALEASGRDLIGDPLHVRSAKAHGAITREAAAVISARRGFSEWHDPRFQNSVVARIERVAAAAGKKFGVGPAGFSLLARRNFGEEVVSNQSESPT